MVDGGLSFVDLKDFGSGAEKVVDSFLIVRGGLVGLV